MPNHSYLTGASEEEASKLERSARTLFAFGSNGGQLKVTQVIVLKHASYACDPQVAQPDGMRLYVVGETHDTQVLVGMIVSQGMFVIMGVLCMKRQCRRHRDECKDDHYHI